MLEAKATLTPQNLSHRRQQVKQFPDEGLRSLGADCFVLRGGAIKLQSYIPAWVSVFCQILLIQPSSAVE